MNCEYLEKCQYASCFYKCSPDECAVYNCFKRETDDLNDIYNYGDCNDTGLVMRLNSQKIENKN